MAKRKSFTVGILVAAGVIALGLAGVGGFFWWTEPQPTKYSGPVEEITIAHGFTPNSALVHIAFVEGHFRDQGLDVEMQLHTSGKESARL